jgi:hypothetical protein
VTIGAGHIFARNPRVELREQVFDDQTLDIGQAEIAPGVTIGQAFVIEAQQAQERRM